jgi:hypothetical protein
MTTHEFVEGVHRQCAGAAIRIMQTVLSVDRPRKSAQGKVLSHWYETLPEQAKKNVDEIIRQTAEHAVFGFLVVLDGERVIEQFEGEKSEFELFAVKCGERFKLVPGNEMLHERYRKLVAFDE